jgi:hypothetical protein
LTHITVFRDKKDIILSEIQACEVLLRYPRVENDTITVEKEILELKFSVGSIAVDSVFF